jgi:hypothetical protein
MMRTTVNIADDVYEMARERAHKKRISLGEALTELVRQGREQTERKPIGIRYENGYPVFDTPQEAPMISLEDIQRAQDLMDEEDAFRAMHPNS